VPLPQWGCLRKCAGKAKAETALGAHGITVEGKRILLGVIWADARAPNRGKGLLKGLEERWLQSPTLAVRDGNADLVKALKMV